MSVHDHELSPELRDLLVDEKLRPEPPGDVQDRVYAKIAASLDALGLDDDPRDGEDGDPNDGDDDGGGPSDDGGGPSGGAPGGHGPIAPPAPPPAGMAGASALAKALLAHPIAVAAGIFTIGAASGLAVGRATVDAPPRETIVYVERPSSGAPAPAASSSGALAVTPVEALPTVVASPPTSPAIAASAPATRGSTVAARDERLAAERALLELAKTAVFRGDPTSALRALDDHSRRFPRGELTEEREAIAIQALAAAGRAGEAHARAEQFEQTFPSSILLPVVHAATGR